MTQKKNGAAVSQRPIDYRYQVTPWVAERRADGWWITKSWSVVAGEKPKWEGPYPYPQDVAIAVARYICVELSNRHMSRVSFRKMSTSDPLYGLPPPPKVTPRRSGKAAV